MTHKHRRCDLGGDGLPCLRPCRVSHGDTGELDEDVVCRNHLVEFMLLNERWDLKICNGCQHVHKGRNKSTRYENMIR